MESSQISIGSGSMDNFLSPPSASPPSASSSSPYWPAKASPATSPASDSSRDPGDETVKAPAKPAEQPARGPSSTASSLAQDRPNGQGPRRRNDHPAAGLGSDLALDLSHDLSNDISSDLSNDEPSDGELSGHLFGDNLSGNNLSGNNLSSDNISGNNLSSDNISGHNLSSDNMSGHNISAGTLSGDSGSDGNRSYDTSGDDLLGNLSDNPGQDRAVSGLANGKAHPRPARPTSPAFGQSVILNKVPRYTTLTVSQPQKVSDGSSSYISYLVTAQQFPGEKPERTRRRFSDFARLYDSLSAEFPACALPPLPDRWRIEYIAGDRFGPEFTTKRAASLQRFLFRVSQHPSLRRSRSFLAFLSSQGLGKAGAGAANGSGAGAAGRGAGLATAGPDSAALSSALDHISEALMNAFSKAKNQSKEMTDAKERAGRYEQNIATLDKAVVRASKTQSELAFDFDNMHKQARKLAKLEPQSSREFEMLADTAQALARATQQLRVGVDSQFACALRDMSHYVQALKGMLKQREQRQIDYEALVEYLKRSEHELVAAEHGQAPAPAFSSSFLKSKMNELRGVDKEQARRQRITKLKGRIAVFKEESQRAKQVSDDYEELAKREVRVFDQTEAIELQQSLAGLSDSYIDFYQKLLHEFRDLEASLD